MKAIEKAARNVYESWMGGTMDDVRRDMVELGKVLNARKEEYDEIKLREERIDEIVRSFKDLKEDYEKMVEEREKMLKNSFKAHKINYPDGTFIFRTKSIISDDMEERGFERGDELKFVIVKTPLAKIIEKK